MMKSVTAMHIYPLFGAYSRLEVLQAAAALQLCPAHAHMLSPLEGLALGACVPGGGKATISPADVQNILESEILGSGSPLATLDDPYEHHFVERFDELEGPYLVFPGATTGGTAPLTSLAAALRAGSGTLPDQFVHEARSLLLGVLKLSNRVVLKARLTVHTEPSGPHWVSDGPVHANVPAPDVFGRLKGAVTFSPGELSGLLGPVSLHVLLTHLLYRPNQATRFAPTGQANPLLLRPVVKMGEALLVACPHSLVAATVRALARLAKHHKVSKLLTALALEVNTQRTEVALHQLKAPQIEFSLGEPPVQTASHAIHLLDADLLLYVVTLTEPLDSVTADKITGHWEIRLPHLKPVAPEDAPPHGMLHLIVIGDHGDGFRLTPHKANRTTPWVVMRVDDLEVFAQAHRDDPTALYRYWQSERALDSQTELYSHNPIERIAFCSELRFLRSFPIPQGSPFILGTVQSNNWRRKLKAERDLRTVPWSDGRTFLAVERGDHSPDGVYFPVVSIWTAAAMFVQMGDASLWVLDGTGMETEEGVEVNGPPSQRNDHPVGEVVQVLAVWLAQMLPLLPPLPQPVATLIIHPARSVPPGTNVSQRETKFGLHVDPDHRTAHLMLGQVFTDLLDRPSNEAERLLLSAVHNVLYRLAVGEPPTPAETINVIEGVAPLGDKRALMAVTVGADSQLDPRNINRPRFVQISEWHAKQVHVGRALAPVHRWEPGAAVVVSRPLMEEANALLFAELQRLVGNCDGQVWLDALLDLYESVLHNAAWHTHTGMTRELTYGPYAKILDARHHVTSTGLRFLIEVFAASPPKGTHHPSVLLLDELLATAVAIVDYGVIGDAANHNLGEVKAEYGYDGCFRASATEYTAASSAQGTHYLRKMMEAANEQRHSVPPGELQAEQRERLNLITEACEELYGLTFAELGGFMNVIQNVGDQFEGRPARLLFSTFLAQLKEESGWPLSKLLLALSPLVLTPRPTFLQPPAPYRKSEVFPWQFNRELSLVRRPLILVESDGGLEVMWGNRMLEASKQYWIYTLFGEARIAIPKEQIQHRKKAAQALQKLKELGATEFNALVAQAARSHGWTVMENVRRFRKWQEHDLGDIDVLAADLRTGRLLVVECKDYTVARTPSELANDFEVLLQGKRKAKGGRERSLLERHVRRTEFVRQQLPVVLQALDLPAGAAWTVEPLVVMSFQPFGLLRNQSPIPLVSIEEFIENLG